MALGDPATFILPYKCIVLRKCGVLNLACAISDTEPRFCNYIRVTGYKFALLNKESEKNTLEVFCDEMIKQK